MARKPSNPVLNLAPEQPQILAQDFNLFYKPKPEPVDRSVQAFTQSLDNFVNSTGKVLALQDELNQKNINEAQAVEDYNNLKLTFKEAVKQGKIDENANPYLIEKYKELDLDGKVNKFRQELYNDYAKNGVAEDTRPNSFTDFYNQKLQEFVSNNELRYFDPVTLNKNFFTQTDKIRNGLLNTHTQTQLGKIGKKYKQGFIDSIINKIEEGKVTGKNNYKNIGDTINQLIQDNIDVKDGTLLRDYTLEALEQYVQNTTDFDFAEQLLDELPKILNGGTNTYDKIGSVKNKIDFLKSELIKERTDYEESLQKSYNARVNTQKIQTRQFLSQNNNNEEFNFYEYKKSDNFKKLEPAVQQDAEKYYSDINNTSFANVTNGAAYVEFYNILGQNKFDEAENFILENKNSFSRVDYEKFISNIIPNARTSTGDTLVTHPRFKEFVDGITKQALSSPLGKIRKGQAYQRVQEYKDDVYQWLNDNPEKNYKNKTERTQAFVTYLNSLTGGFSFSGTSKKPRKVNTEELD